MKTPAAIRTVMMNVLSIAENQPMAVKISHMARTAPRCPYYPAHVPIVLTGALWLPGRAGQGALDALRSARSMGMYTARKRQSGWSAERALSGSTETAIRSWNRPVSADIYPFNGISGHAINYS